LNSKVLDLKDISLCAQETLIDVNPFKSNTCKDFWSY
jgi:hypothetical protein